MWAVEEEVRKVLTSACTGSARKGARLPVMPLLGMRMKATIGSSCLAALFLFMGASAQAQQKLDSLLVYGKAFVFSVKEPDGWVGDTQHAGEYQVNVLFYPQSQNWKTASGLIRVRVGDKTDEKTEEDLAADMDGYRSQYPTIQFKDFAVSHSKYRVYSKLFFVQNEFYEYVVYVNPGPQSVFMFSVAMNKQKREATRSELAVLGRVIASLEMLTAPQPGAPADAAQRRR